MNGETATGVAEGKIGAHYPLPFTLHHSGGPAALPFPLFIIHYSLFIRRQSRRPAAPCYSEPHSNTKHPMAAVELRGVTKRWGNFTAVDNQSLMVADREFLALLGPSGCGKTTALRMIAGLEDPTEGDILIGGRVVTDDAPKDRDVAMVFQNYGLYPHMTVEENIAFPLKVRGQPAEEITPRARAAAEKARIGELLKRKPRALSGGQRQRVALARAIVRSPQVFLMDEPLSNLDAQLRTSMRAEIQHLSRELRVTTVYVTHDQMEAMTLADRVAVMNGGRIRQLDAPEEIYNNPADLFVAGFIGSPPMNLIPGARGDNTFVANGLQIQLAQKHEDSAKDVVLGMRPEDVSVTEPGAGHFDAPIYAFEKTGDSALAVAEVAGIRFTARGDRDLRLTIGEAAGFRMDLSRARLFDKQSGHRIRERA